MKQIYNNDNSIKKFSTIISAFEKALLIIIILFFLIKLVFFY